MDSVENLERGWLAAYFLSLEDGLTYVKKFGRHKRWSTPVTWRDPKICMFSNICIEKMSLENIAEHGFAGDERFC